MISTNAKRAASKYAAVGLYFTADEWVRLNIAVGRSGKSRRRFVKDAALAAAGLPPSQPVKPGRARGEDLTENEKSPGGKPGLLEATTDQGRSYANPSTRRNRHG